MKKNKSLNVIEEVSAWFTAILFFAVATMIITAFRNPVRNHSAQHEPLPCAVSMANY